MKRSIGIILMVAGIAILTGLGIFYWKNLRGIGPVINKPPEDITKIINETSMPLKIPQGFKMEIFAKDLLGARVMTWAPDGALLVSVPSQGKIIALRDKDGDGEADSQKTILKDLNKPHGIAFQPNSFMTVCNGECEEYQMLFVAETDGVSLWPYRLKDGKIIPGYQIREKLPELPSGDGHFTRTMLFPPGEDNKFLISVGSSCNVCEEKDSRRAKILQYDPKTKELTTFASGLRNSVFMTLHPVTGDIWATDMGRDLLGDDLPPDEINIIEEGKDYGWPICYGKNIHDGDFDKNVYIRDPCADKEPSYIDIPAHSAPLGLAFIPEEGWPEDYWYDLLVAYHGSWNRSTPTGYKIVRFKLDAHGKYEGVEDFVSGWLTPDGALGRPVDILVQPGGTVYISDDKAGVIYRMSRISEEEPEGKTDLIFVDTPERNESIQSPLVVKGKARGNWYFEASFPVRLLDANGKELALAVAQAKENWMTSDFVPFEVTLRFSQPETETGTLVLEKDNASGLPEHDDALRIPIRFEKVSECVITGCSGQICAEEEMFTTCEYKPEYACYKQARCERQLDGKCGWTPLPDLNDCIDQARRS